MVTLTQEQIEQLNRSIEEKFPSTVAPAFWSYIDEDEQEEEEVA